MAQLLLRSRATINTMEETSEAFEAINSDYEMHSRTVQAIAEEYLRAETVLARVLDDFGF